MLGFSYFLLVSAFAEDSCSQDEATLLQLQGLRNQVQLQGLQKQTSGTQSFEVGADFDMNGAKATQAVAGTQADMGSTWATSDGASLEVHHPIIRGCERVWRDAVSRFPRMRLNDTSAGTSNVRCCSEDGSSCTSPGCHSDKTFAEAEQICASEGKRLCRESEVLGNRCCGSGCGFDGQFIWARQDQPMLLSGNDECPHCTCQLSAPIDLSRIRAVSACENAFDGEWTLAAFYKNGHFELNFPDPVLVDHVDLYQHVSQQIFYRNDFIVRLMDENGQSLLDENGIVYMGTRPLGSEGDGHDSIKFEPPLRASKVWLSFSQPSDRPDRNRLLLEELQVYGWPLSK